CDGSARHFTCRPPAFGGIPRQRALDHAARAAGQVAGAPMPHKTLNERTLDFWQARTSRELTEEDAREIVANVSGFFRLLAEWDRKAQRKESHTQLGRQAEK